MFAGIKPPAAILKLVPPLMVPATVTTATYVADISTRRWLFAALNVASN
jgi:hypothetical protein